MTHIKQPCSPIMLFVTLPYKGLKNKAAINTKSSSNTVGNNSEWAKRPIHIYCKHIIILESKSKSRGEVGKAASKLSVLEPMSNSERSWTLSLSHTLWEGNASAYFLDKSGASQDNKSHSRSLLDHKNSMRTPTPLSSASAMLRRRLLPSLRTRGGSDSGRWTSPGHEERPKGYLFNRTPLPPGQSRKWEDWELPCYITSFLTIVILGVGLNAKPDLTIETWAHEKALERLKMENNLAPNNESSESP
ncbi:hypothetical protein VNO77_21888 [Canavalia gladiata]|uniref:NADH-ubiquinone oxidoreductase ESSS subunit n=1 Tax=Canavalia gladiata TaxID=3824 RepID=A0AAN9QAA3_CANGL